MPADIDILLPCYKPNDTWHDELLKFYDFIRPHYTVNFILVNDGSPEDRLLRQIGILKGNGVPMEYISYKVNRGKGFALRHGLLTSTSTHVIYTDVDFPFSEASMLAVIDLLVSGKHDIVAGYRNKYYYDKKMSWFRKKLSQVFRYFLKNVLRMPVSDTQCGLKGFNEKGRRKFMATTINRYLFDFEFIYMAMRDRSLSVGVIEVQLKDNVVFSRMRLNTLLRETLNLLKVLIRR